MKFARQSVFGELHYKKEAYIVFAVLLNTFD